MRAVIFDWDLTLWNSWDIHLRLMQRTALELGVTPPDAGEIAAEFHRPFHPHLLWFFGSAPDAWPELDGIVAVYMSHYHRMAGHRNYLYPGAASLLRALRRWGIRVGVVSDKLIEFGKAELAQSGLAAMVEAASFKTDARPFKPAPAGLLDVLQRLDVAPADALYVGDAPQDVRCAQAAGAQSAAALWAAIDADATLAAAPRYRLHRPHQVMAVIAAANGHTAASPWRRHLPWPWQPDADNPADDQDVGVNPADVTAPDATEPAGVWQYWPLSTRWRGHSDALALPADVANPVAPLAVRGSDAQ